jgi:hypothetical protein
MKMRKKCKSCGAPLSHERCDYCGTSHGAPQQPAAEDIASAPNFDIPNGTPQSSQPEQMMMESKGSSSVVSIIIGIIFVLAIAIAVRAWFVIGSGSDSQVVNDVLSENSTLLGTWENGSGRIFLFVFDRAESVEFLENGTVIITQPNGDRNTVNWNLDGSGAFTADRRQFTYSINGDVLTITDSANDDWMFDRAASGTTHLDVDTATEVAPTEIESTEGHEIVGEWDFFGTPWYRFYADGSAVNLQTDQNFTWGEDGSLDSITYESWRINDNTLTVTWASGVSFEYIRID